MANTHGETSSKPMEMYLILVAVAAMIAAAVAYSNHL
jgi:hypothetical protein